MQTHCSFADLCHRHTARASFSPQRAASRLNSRKSAMASVGVPGWDLTMPWTTALPRSSSHQPLSASYRSRLASSPGWLLLLPFADQTAKTGILVPLPTLDRPNANQVGDQAIRDDAFFKGHRLQVESSFDRFLDACPRFPIAEVLFSTSPDRGFGSL